MLRLKERERETKSKRPSLKARRKRGCARRRRRFCFCSLSSLSLPSSLKKAIRQVLFHLFFFFFDFRFFVFFLPLALSTQSLLSSTGALVSPTLSSTHAQCRPQQPRGLRAATAESTQRRRRRPLQRLLDRAPLPKTAETRAAVVRRAPGGRRRSAHSTWC